ncbi:hypothetical protein [uncultured Muribaculum sp.]|uniref:hypothetical protein n=1 Tax=uncultured Muribaculum sp. TaxID=1918613 RepID=UPI002615FA24|nr:hypothetical protein [uncultured Muribaculum sp.]
MSLPRITAGERRGLIALIIVLCIVTGVLCWRDFSCAPVTESDLIRGENPSVALPPDSILDSVSASQVGMLPLGETDSTARRAKQKRAKSGRKPKAASPKSNQPRPRNPRDERVD